jgi:hypothetical protein
MTVIGLWYLDPARRYIDREKGQGLTFLEGMDEALRRSLRSSIFGPDQDFDDSSGGN